MQDKDLYRMQGLCRYSDGNYSEISSKILKYLFYDIKTTRSMQVVGFTNVR